VGAVAIHVILADDDRAIRNAVARALSLDGYVVRTATDGLETLAAIRAAAADVLILDVMMPNLDGLTVCRMLRAEGDRTPILMLTARTETSARVAGLDAGADDYLAKPFELAELLARLRALVRRSRLDDQDQSWRVLEVADLRLDPEARRVWRGTRQIELTKTEFDLLELLMLNQGVVLEHTAIYDRIWGYDFGIDSKNLAVFISYLRRKVEDDGSPRLIHTIRGVGYTIRP
jgi:two-component system, OmpR family, response regulator MprA